MLYREHRAARRGWAQEHVNWGINTDMAVYLQMTPNLTCITLILV